MRITKCDICKKDIKKTEGEINISTGGLFHGYFDVCGNCAKPILKFLESKKLIEKNGKRRK
jgi:hypothetical protein